MLYASSVFKMLLANAAENINAMLVVSNADLLKGDTEDKIHVHKFRFNEGSVSPKVNLNINASAFISIQMVQKTPINYYYQRRNEEMAYE